MSVPPKTGPHELVISEGLSLMYDQTAGQGKTRDMAKGLLLRSGTVLCAGESAGLGLPVLKTSSRTVFPSLASLKPVGTTILEMEFRMDRVVVWHAGRKTMPDWVGHAMERLVDAYMKKPFLQHRLLRLRDRVFAPFAVHSAMAAGDCRGHCLVTCEAIPRGLSVSVDASRLQGPGQLIVLNEVDGESFNRLRDTGRVWLGTDMPAWQAATFDAMLESPSLGVGISLEPGEHEDPSGLSLFGGREVAQGLNWAGLAVTGRRPVLSYRVRFHSLFPPCFRERSS